MKLQSHNNKLETNVEGETQEFGIGNASVVIEILRNRLYQNKIQTLCQEYICNARDSHREAGKPDNTFTVTVPTALNPVFKVRDFGVGITPDRMKSVFIMYGNSTKRSTNNQTGGFGLGAKSAWSYSDSFTIVSVTGGMRRMYVAHTGVNNNGRLDHISTDPTTESNGTEIQVAVNSSDIEEFRTAIHRAVHFWPSKPQLKGETSPPILTTGKRLGILEVISSSDLPSYTTISEWSNEMLALIDGVPYHITDKLIDKVPNLKKLATLIKQKVILHLPNGVIEVAASRESIADSKHTVDNLNRIAGKSCMEVTTHISSEFAKVTDNASFLATYARLSESFHVDSFAKFGDYAIDDGFIKSDSLLKVSMTSITNLNRRNRKVDKITKSELTNGQKTIDIENLDDIFYVNTDESKVKLNKRIREYLQTHSRLLLIAPMTGLQAEFDKVVKDLAVKDIQTITYVEVPKDPKNPKAKIVRENAEFCYSRLGYGRYQYTTLARNTQKWLYVQTKDGAWDGFDYTDLQKLSNYLEESIDTKICGLAARSIKMVQGDPNYLPLKDFLDAYKPTKADILATKSNLSEHSELGSVVSSLDVKDELLTSIGKEYKKFRNINKFPPALLRAKVEQMDEVKEFKTNDEEFGKLVNKRYPLLNSLKYCSEYKEISAYVDAKYKDGK